MASLGYSELMTVYGNINCLLCFYKLYALNYCKLCFTAVMGKCPPSQESRTLRMHPNSTSAPHQRAVAHSPYHVTSRVSANWSYKPRVLGVVQESSGICVAVWRVAALRLPCVRDRLGKI